MSAYKIVNTDYTLTCNGGDGIFTVNAQTVFEGNVTYTVPAVTMSPFITVAANNTGSISDMGLLAQLSNTTFAGLRFDAVANAWQISNRVDSNGSPVVNYLNIATGNLALAGSNTQIQYNAGSNMGASANLTFDYGNNVLTLTGVEALKNLGVAAPTNAVANTTLLFSNPSDGGATGLYFVSANSSGELISKKQAIIYSLIF
jgi:hypothetical protein